MFYDVSHSLEAGWSGTQMLAGSVCGEGPSWLRVAVLSLGPLSGREREVERSLNEALTPFTRALPS